MLSQGGVAPRTAQAAMRHSKIDLTMNVYVAPRLLDVAGAMESLPNLPLHSEARQSPDDAKATGTAGPFAPKTVQTGQSGSLPVTLGKGARSKGSEADEPETGEKPTKKALLPGFGNKAFERARRDLNSQPPDRQSGALTN